MPQRRPSVGVDSYRLIVTDPRGVRGCLIDKLLGMSEGVAQMAILCHENVWMGVDS